MFCKAKELEEKQKEEPLQNPSNHRIPTPEEQRKAKENPRALDEHLAKEHNTTPLYKIDELAAKIKPISEELEKDEIPRETVR
ncbi:hypothetical protein MSHOH_3130 [Methanosarcina horonobensis HB-1 = JCM 15518]|uniref:Uncharacterized protein n=1 Tax=Methanosarcina horonobensis HB-1 = JCM 15518 TaxID=1434110 RepID=A0A0E3SI71_9EURY|nr:hypothetical protein [Methanosarcina horonobensis]AKB79613.1 hypothetical protein MSHOH_3130 [Methanosarcina horonobensis HB-1 = JCM 15518]